MNISVVELCLAVISAAALIISLIVLRLALTTRSQQLQELERTKAALAKAHTESENARQSITDEFRRLLNDQHSLAATAANEQFEKLVHALDDQLAKIEKQSSARLEDIDKKQSEVPKVADLVEQVKTATNEEIEKLKTILKDDLATLQTRQSTAQDQLKRIEQKIAELSQLPDKFSALSELPEKMEKLQNDQTSSHESTESSDRRLRADLEELRTILKRMAESVANKLSKSEAEIEGIIIKNEAAMQSATLDKFLLLMDSDQERKAAALSFVRDMASEEMFAELASRYPSTVALAALEQMAKKSDRKEVYITALSRLADQKLEANLLQEARTLYMQAIDMVQESPDFNPAVLLPIYSKLARLCRLENDLDYAKVISKRVGDAQKSMNAEQHQQSIEALSELTQLYEANNSSSGKLEEAYKRLHESYIATGQLDHLDAARNLRKLADVYLADSRFEDAEPAYQRALSAFSKALDADDPELTSLMKNLANTYFKLNRLEQAETIYAKLLTAQVNAKAKDEVVKAVAHLEEIAEAYASRNSFHRAEAAYNQCAKSLKQVLKPSDARLKRIYEKLEDLCAKADDKDHLKKFYKEQMEATKYTLHKSPAYTNNTLKLATLHAADGNLREAESLFKSVENLKSSDSDTAQFLDELAKACSSQAKYELAQSAYKKSLEVKGEIHGLSSVELIDSYSSLGASYSVQRDYVQAEQMYKRALELTEKNHGFGSAQIITPLMHLAGCYIISGQFAEAEPCYKRILETRYKTQGEEHADIIVSLLHLAELYRIQKNFTEAEIFYESACEMAERMYGAESLAVAEIIEKQATLAKQDDQQERAMELTDRASKIRKAADSDSVLQKTPDADAATR